MNRGLVCLRIKVSNFYLYPLIYRIFENWTKCLFVFESLQKNLAFWISERLYIKIWKVRIYAKTNFIITLWFILPFEVLLHKFLLINELSLFFKVELLAKKDPWWSRHNLSSFILYSYLPFYNWLLMYKNLVIGVNRYLIPFLLLCWRSSKDKLNLLLFLLFDWIMPTLSKTCPRRSKPDLRLFL